MENQLEILITVLVSFLVLIISFKMIVFLYIKVKYGNEKNRIQAKIEKIKNKGMSIGKIKDVSSVEGKRLIIKATGGIFNVRGKFIYTLAGDEVYYLSGNVYICGESRINKFSVEG